MLTHPNIWALVHFRQVYLNFREAYFSFRYMYSSFREAYSSFREVTISVFINLGIEGDSARFPQMRNVTLKSCVPGHALYHLVCTWSCRVHTTHDKPIDMMLCLLETKKSSCTQQPSQGDHLQQIAKFQSGNPFFQFGNGQSTERRPIYYFSKTYYWWRIY